MAGLRQRKSQAQVSLFCMHSFLVQVASVPAEDTAEMKISESDSERKEADTNHEQANVPWVGDGTDILQYRLSRLSSCII